MSVESVRNYLKEYGLEDRVQEFEVSSATVELAAAALECEPCRIAKTLSFLVEEQPILIVVAGDAKVQNGKYKQHFHCKAKMMDPQTTLERIGHPVGGVCPFAVKEDVQVFLDVSLKRFDWVYPACGSGNSAVGLTPEELEKASQALAWVDVCTIMEETAAP